MKIIEAMKRVKENHEKIADLNKKILENSAGLSIETPPYGSAQGSTVAGWLQTCEDLARDNVELLVAIQRTNLATLVSIEIDEQVVTKTIAEWIWRRREYAKLCQRTWEQLSTRNLKDGQIQTAVGQPVTEVKVVRYYDQAKRDKMVSRYLSEPHRIDATLEVINATTELVL